MNDERLVANVYDSRDSVARAKRGRGTGYVLHGPVIITMFNFLKQQRWRARLLTFSRENRRKICNLPKSEIKFGRTGFGRAVNKRCVRERGRGETFGVVGSRSPVSRRSRSSRERTKAAGVLTILITYH